MGFAGTNKGSFFEAAEHVVNENKPGNSPNPAYLKPGWCTRIFNPINVLLFSPNTVWCAIALLVYFAFPYDFESAKQWAWEWVLFRFAVNTGTTFAYVGFWHLSLYFLNWGKRPFNDNRQYNVNKVIHNMWYSFLGCTQWTMWEAIWMHCYATGRLPYVTDEGLGTDFWKTLTFGLTCFIVPVYREFHFYLCHRFIHIRVLYKYVHSLHHRNTDIEPFAGLSMHPVEHLYYYSCAFPALYFFCSPFAFHWNGMHLLLSPAASHSGWEDHFQADQFHYLHHRFFECNYGTEGVPYDRWFGTYRELLDGESKTYKGKGEHVDDKNARIMDAKATLFSAPSQDTVLYYALLLPIGLFVLKAVQEQDHEKAKLAAFAASVGPILAGMLLLLLTSKNVWKQGLRYTFLYPFHEESFFGAFGINFLLSFVVSVVPVYHVVEMLIGKPGDAVYFQIYG